MNVGKTLFAKVMEFVPWTSFARIVQRHSGNAGVRTLTCAEQFRAMAFAQLTWRESLRDIEASLSANVTKLYAMGFRSTVRRATLTGGKDSALALQVLREDHRYEVMGLLTTVNEYYGRVSMHGVREALLDTQAKAVGAALYKVKLSAHPSNDEYEEKMRTALLGFRAQGIRQVAFGDLFLEDLRQYRIDNMRKCDMQCVFPLWQRPTDKLAHEFIALGFKALLCCVDEQQLTGAFVGREYDENLLRDLPRTIDPCGERGEFHTFVYAGPIFRQPVPFARGEHVRRDERFHFCDLIPQANGIDRRVG